MTAEICLPEPTFVDVPLVARRVLGDGTTAADALDPARVSFGMIDPVPLGSSADRRHHFTVLGFTCSFRPDADPIVETRLAIRLAAEDTGSGQDRPIFWSLTPERLAREVRRTRQLSLSPQLTFAIGASGGYSSEQQYTTEECYVVGTGRGEPTAEWYFRQTTAVPLEGMHDVQAIVRSPASTPARATVRMAAKIRRRVAGIVSYRAELPSQLQDIAIAVSG